MTRIRVPIVLAAIVVGLALLVPGVVVGLRVYWRSDVSHLNNPPWQAGLRLTPLTVAGHDQLVSYASARLIRRQLQAVLGGEPENHYRAAYSFDPDARRFRSGDPVPTGRIASVTALPASGSRTQERSSVRIGLYTGTAERDAETARVITRTEGTGATVVDRPEVPGAAAVSVLHSTDSCTLARSRTDSLTAVAAVGARTFVLAEVDCVVASDVSARQSDLVILLGRTLGAARGLESAVLPERVFDQTDHYPILSSGSWSDAQVTVPAGADPAELTELPRPLRRAGVRLWFEAAADVVVTDDAATAQRLLDDVEDWRIDSSHPAARTVPVSYADVQVCLPPEHPQEDERCLTRVGRFVIISVQPRARPGVEAQAALLRGLN